MIHERLGQPGLSYLPWAGQKDHLCGQILLDGSAERATHGDSYARLCTIVVTFMQMNAGWSLASCGHKVFLQQFHCRREYLIGRDCLQTEGTRTTIPLAGAAGERFVDDAV